MYYLTIFKHFVSIFSMIFDPFDPHFHRFFYKTLDPIGYIFLSLARNMATENLVVISHSKFTIYGKLFDVTPCMVMNYMVLYDITMLNSKCWFSFENNKIIIVSHTFIGWLRIMSHNVMHGQSFIQYFYFTWISHTIT